MQNLKIFVDAHQFDEGYDGAATYIKELYRHLTNLYPANYLIHVGCHDLVSARLHFPDSSKFILEQYPTKNRIMRLLFYIPYVIYRCKPDVAHFQYTAPLIKQCPWIVVIHDVLFNDFPYYFPKRYGFLRNILFCLTSKRADCLITGSQYSMSRISFWYSIPMNKIKLLRYGYAPKPKVNLTQCLQVGTFIANNPKYFLCVSRFEPRKNQTAVLNAYLNGKFHLEGIQLVFVGATTIKTKDFESCLGALDSNVLKMVHVFSDLQYSDVMALYQNSLAHIYPSFAEGYGIPPLEAIAAGVPSIISNRTSLKEFRSLGLRMFEPDDHNELQRILRSIVDNPSAYIEKLDEIAIKASLEYSWNNAATNLHIILQNVLNDLSPK